MSTTRPSPRRARRHLSVWNESRADAGRTDPEAERRTHDAVASVTHELLGNLAVVRGVARLLLQDPTVATGDRSELLAVLDRQVDLMQRTLSGLTIHT